MNKGSRFSVHGHRPDPYAKLRFTYKMPPHGSDTSALSFKMSLIGIASRQLCFGISVGAYSTAKN